MSEPVNVYPERASRFVAALSDVLTGEQIHMVIRKVWGSEHSPTISPGGYDREIHLSTQQRELLDLIFREPLSAAADENLKRQLQLAQAEANKYMENAQRSESLLGSLRYLGSQLRHNGAQLIDMADRLAPAKDAEPE